jgi:hypothetical protein
MNPPRRDGSEIRNRPHREMRTEPLPRTEPRERIEPLERTEGAAPRDIDGLLRAAPPEEIDDRQWSDVFARIERSLETPGPRLVSPYVEMRRQTRSDWFQWSTGLVAAAVLVAFGGYAGLRMFALDDDAIASPYAVASTDDVDIESVHGNDIATLVVGTHPLREPVALARLHEIVVENLSPADDGMVPDVRADSDEPSSPMIVAPTPETPKANPQ